MMNPEWSKINNNHPIIYSLVAINVQLLEFL